MATVFDTVDECNCGVLATQASVGPTRVGCYFLIVIATAGAGGFYRSTGLPAGTVVIICIVVFGSRAANVAVCDINGPLFDGLTGVSRVGGAELCRSGRRPSAFA